MIPLREVGFEYSRNVLKPAKDVALQYTVVVYKAVPEPKCGGS